MYKQIDEFQCRGGRREDFNMITTTNSGQPRAGQVVGGPGVHARGAVAQGTPPENDYTWRFRCLVDGVGRLYYRTCPAVELLKAAAGDFPENVCSTGTNQRAIGVCFTTNSS